MSASVVALLFVGALLTALGLFVAGNLAVVALGVAALFGAGAVRDARAAGSS